MVFKFYVSILLSITLINCNDRSELNSIETMKTVNYVDLEKYMGDWYVIANIPTFIEKNATNAIESYKLSSDGITHTTFSFYKGSPEGEKKIYRPKGFVFNKETNAEWRMQFLWPFKMPFLIIDLDDDYSYTVIGIPSRKHVWIMSRDPIMNDETYEGILSRLSDVGYDTSMIQRIVQDWN
mgnify:CR=1 FL=1